MSFCTARGNSNSSWISHCSPGFFSGGFATYHGGKVETVKANKRTLAADNWRSAKEMELAQRDMTLVETDMEKSSLEKKGLAKWDMALEEWNMAHDDKRGKLEDKALPRNEPERLSNGPPFDPDGWCIRRSDDTVPWSSPQQGLIKFTGEVEFGTDLSPRESRNWMMEVCFKPEAFRTEQYENTIFSQHGYGNGWELRCKQGAVELIFTPGNGRDFSYNQKFIRSSSVERGQWTHVLVFFDQSTSTLWCYVNGVGPVKKNVNGRFRPCPLSPRLGRNPEWPDRAFRGEVAFARVDQQPPLAAGKDLSKYAATLADARLSDLE